MDDEQKYRKTGVLLPPMHFHSMENQLYRYDVWCNMWFGSRCEFMIHMWALLEAWQSKEQVSESIPMDSYTDMAYQVIQDARQFFATITHLDDLTATSPRLPSLSLTPFTVQLENNLSNFLKTG